MGIGIGIFFGLFFIGTIYLYTQTREVWNWRKIWKRSGIVLAILIALPFIIGAFVVAYESITKYLDDIPSKATTLQGLSLGEKLSDVEFKLPLKKADVQYNSEKFTTYLITGQPLRDLSFDKNNVLASIGESCTSDFNIQPPFESVNQVGCGSTGETIIDRYGKNKVRILCASKKRLDEDKGLREARVRVYDAIEYGVRHYLAGNKLFGIDIATPEELKTWTGINWVPCEELEKLETPKK